MKFVWYAGLVVEYISYPGNVDVYSSHTCTMVWDAIHMQAMLWDTCHMLAMWYCHPDRGPYDGADNIQHEKSLSNPHCNAHSNIVLKLRSNTISCSRASQLIQLIPCNISVCSVWITSESSETIKYVPLRHHQYLDVYTYIYTPVTVCIASSGTFSLYLWYLIEPQREP